MKQRDCTDRSD